MRFRPLALFALTAGLAVLIGEFGATDAFAQEKKEKKGKKKKADPPPAAAPPSRHQHRSRSSQWSPNFKPLAIPAEKDAAAIAKLIDAEVAKKLAEAKVSAVAARVGR